jgi:hypothetical protein
MHGEPGSVLGYHGGGQEVMMAKVGVFNDYAEFAHLIGSTLEHAGHEVIALHLYRKAEALNRPLADLEADVLGYRPLMA